MELHCQLLPRQSASVTGLRTQLPGSSKKADAHVQGRIHLELQLGSNSLPSDAPLHLRLFIRSAVGIASASALTSSSDAYVVVHVGSQPAKRTAVKEKSLKPVWNEEFRFAYIR